MGKWDVKIMCLCCKCVNDSMIFAFWYLDMSMSRANKAIIFVCNVNSLSLSKQGIFIR